MYIQKIKIENIKSIDNLEIDFGNSHSGWHVILGENGSGKSTLLKSIAIALISEGQIGGILPVWKDWLRNGEKNGKIELIIDNSSYKNLKVDVILQRKDKDVFYSSNHLSGATDFFTVGYGPFRRFTSEDNIRARVSESFPKAGAHLSLFNTEVSFAKALDWLKELDRKSVKESVEKSSVSFEAQYIFESIKNFINKSELLPQKVTFEKVNIEGDVIFRDENNLEISINHLSDGYRSILSMVLDLINQMVSYFGAKEVLKHTSNEAPYIDVSGLVMIDEIDAHLHPEWQTKIGQWFTKAFPKVQFLVTTHSPLVCREAADSNIWKLSTFNGKFNVQKIEGIDKERLTKGNILEAYSTEIFGKSPSQSTVFEDDKHRLGKLNMMAALGKISKKDELERQKLLKIHSSL